ncbi:MAG: YtxH domain-containing protein [Ignavibacteria bacterium]
MSRDNGVAKGLLIGFLTGSVVGSVIALLYTPKSGKELRKDIREKTDEFVEDAEKYIADARGKAVDLINDGKKKSERIIADAKVKVESLLHDAEKVLNEAKEKTDGFVNNSKDTVLKEGDKLKSAIKAGVDAYKNEQKS